MLALQFAQEPTFEELARDPLLAVACVLLMVVSIGWIVVTRIIARELKRAAARDEVPTRGARPPRDIWAYPP